MAQLQPAGSLMIPTLVSWAGLSIGHVAWLAADLYCDPDVSLQGSKGLSHSELDERRKRRLGDLMPPLEAMAESFIIRCGFIATQ